ncbi:MAG: alpha/beta hydrolase, partial [Acidobacteria bacterium]|nr:alpha/beta hydrolase [Acidobacteriota bacterium]
FHLEPAAPAPAAPAPPAPPPPYVEEDVQFENGAVKLAGTLTLPKGSGPFPAVVLLTGSGPQNRDEELFGFQPFRVLTDQLTRKGIAVLRYDDRGVGGSSGNTLESTSEDFAGDALAAVALLKARPAIAGQKIGLLGHSEGGIVAPLAAVRSRDVAYIVLLSGTGVTGEAVMLDQAERIARAEGRTPEQIARNTRLQKRIFAAVRSGEGWEELEGAIRAEALDGIESLPAAERGAIADPGEYAGNAAKAQLQFAKSRWFRFFLDYDPATALAKVKVPVLALFGERDLQVATDLNRPAIAGALARAGNKDVTVKVIPGANHLYQAAKTGSVGEYATLPKEFVPGLTDLIADWILQQAAR